MCSSFQMPRSCRRDAAFRQNGRGLHLDQAGAALRAAAQVHKVPVVGKAVLLEYWHMGETPMRLANSTERSLKGRKKRSGHTLLDDRSAAVIHRRMLAVWRS